MTDLYDWFLVFATLGYIDKENNPKQVPFDFITHGDSEKITMQGYEAMCAYAEKHALEFIGEDNIQKLTAVVVHSISHLGRMSKEEFEGTKNANNV